MMTTKAKILDLSSAGENFAQSFAQMQGLHEMIGHGRADKPIEPADVVRFVHGTGLSHVVQERSVGFEAELRVADSMIHDPEKFLTHPLDIIFGSNDTEKPDGANDAASLNVMNSADEKKLKTLSLFENFLVSVPGTRTIRDTALVIADELYTNGAKVSWTEAKGRAGTVEFFARADAKRLVFGCRDTYGTLDLQHVIGRMRRVYENGVAGSINQGTGGAGIGSWMVFDGCSSYYAAVAKGRCTVVCVALPLGLSSKELGHVPKNIHLMSVA